MTQKRRMAYTKKADAAFGKVIRARGVCELRPMHPSLECSGAIQCCHIISRRYRAIRWCPDNALAGCQAHHVYFTHRPLEWEDACKKAGIEYDNLRYLALTDPPEDPFEALERWSA